MIYITYPPDEPPGHYTHQTAALHEEALAQVKRELLRQGLGNADLAGLVIEDGYRTHDAARRGRQPAAWRITVHLADGSMQTFARRNRPDTTTLNADGTPLVDLLT